MKERPLAKVAVSSLIGASYAVPAIFPFVFPALALYGLYSQVQRNLKEKIKEDGKINYKKLLYPSTYIPNFANPLYMAEGLGSLHQRATNKAYDLGSRIANFLGEITKAPTGIAPQTAAATAPA